MPAFKWLNTPPEPQETQRRSSGEDPSPSPVQAELKSVFLKVFHPGTLQ
jgi:hypothetical protein